MNYTNQNATSPMQSLSMAGGSYPPLMPSVQSPLPPRAYLASVYQHPGFLGGCVDVSYANIDIWDRNHIRDGKREREQGMVRVVNPAIGLQEGGLLYTRPDAGETYGGLYVVQTRAERSVPHHVLTPARAFKITPHPGLEGEDIHIKMFVADALENAALMAERVLQHSYRGLSIQAAVELHSRRMQYHFCVQRVRSRWCTNSYLDPWRVAQMTIGNRVEEEVWKKVEKDPISVLQPGSDLWDRWDEVRADTHEMARGLSNQINKSLVEGVLRQYRKPPSPQTAFSMER